MRLRGNNETNDPRLDRIYQEDWNSLRYRVEEYRLRSYTWSCNVFNDQGREGACVGFGWGHDLCARPAIVLVDGAFSRKIYLDAQKIDEWAGENYEGTSVLAGAKVVKSLGYMDEYRWAVTLREWVSGVGFTGPAVIGVNWYTGMFGPDASGFIRATGQIEGGHCVLVKAVKLVFKAGMPKTFENLDLDKSYFVIHNSWGQDWGVNGTAKLSLRDADKLLNEQGDVCFPVRRRTLAA